MDKPSPRTKQADAAQLPLPVLEDNGTTGSGVKSRALVGTASAKPAAAIQSALPQALPVASIVLGEALDEQGRKTNHPITLGIEELFAGTHVLGIPRHGKTALLINVFLQLAEQGYGACYIDPHGDAITDILARLPLERKQDVIILDPTHETHSFGLNLLRCDNPASDTQMTYAYDQLWSVFTKLWADKETGEMGIWMQKFVSNAILTFLEHPGYTVADIPLLLTSKAHREHFARSLKNSVVARFWTAEFDSLPKNYQWVEIESTLTRLNRFLQNPIIRSIVGQGRSTLNFREVMNTKKLLLVHFPVRLPEDFRTLLGAMLITQLQDAMFSRRDTPKPDRVPFFLLVDEVQEVATKQFTKFFEEGGKYHVGTIAAHQHLSQEGLSASVRNGLLTAGNKVYLRVNDPDADIVAPGFAKAPVEAPLTIPRNVTTYLKQHEHPLAKEFYALYCTPIEIAKGDREHEETDVSIDFYGHREKARITYYPSWDFGAGEVEFTREQLFRLDGVLNDLVYETLEGRLPASELQYLWLKLVLLMAYFLKYETYADFLYRGRNSLFTADVRGKAAEEIAEYERLKNLLSSFQASDIDIMRFFMAFQEVKHWNGKEHSYKEYKKLFDGKVAYSVDRDKQKLPLYLKQYIEKPGEEVRKFFLEKITQYQELAERYKSARTYVQYVIDNSGKANLEMWKGVGSYSLENTVKYERRRFAWLGDFGKRLLLGSIESEIARRLPYKMVNELSGNSDLFRFGIRDCTIAEAEKILAGPEALIARLSKPYRNNRLELHSRGGYFWNTPEETWAVLTRDCQEKYAFFEPRNTPEKLLAVIRAELEAEIAEIDAKLQPLYKERDYDLANSQRYLDEQKAREKARHDCFVANLETLLKILQHPQYTIRVTSSNAMNRREKTAGEMIDLTAMELRSLPKYTALCKIVAERSTVTHRLDLLPLPAPHSDSVVSVMTARIWQRMEAEYYRPKAAINDEITRRQELPSPDTGAFVKLPGRA